MKASSDLAACEAARNAFSVLAFRAMPGTFVRPAAGRLAIGVVPLGRAGVLDKALPLDVEACRKVAAGAELEQWCGHDAWALVGFGGAVSR